MGVWREEILIYNLDSNIFLFNTTLNITKVENVILHFPSPRRTEQTLSCPSINLSPCWSK